MNVSIPINLTTNVWNVIKFIFMYITLDTLIPTLLESIDKSKILYSLTHHGRVPIQNFTKHRHARTGLRRLLQLILRRFRNPKLHKSHYTFTIRPLLLCTIWLASLTAEYDSGSQNTVSQLETSVQLASRESLLHAMFTCVIIQPYPHHRHQTLVRHATVTKQGLKCSCTTPTEVACTMPIRVDRIPVTSSNTLLSNATASFFTGSTMSKFSSNQPVNITTHKNHVRIHARGNCEICSAQHMGRVQDIPYNVYASLNSNGTFERPAIYTATLETGTLVGFAAVEPTRPESGLTLDSLVHPSTAVSFLEAAWERPNWKLRAAVTRDLTRILEAINAGNERSPEFSAIWTSWWLRGNLEHSRLGVVTLNTSATETATISLVGLFSFSYVIVVSVVLLVCSAMRGKWRGLEINGCGNVEWVISALIGQQQQGISSWRGVKHFEEFDLTIVEHGNGVHRVSAQHRMASVTLASPIDLHLIDGKKQSDEHGGDIRENVRQ